MSVAIELHDSKLLAVELDAKRLGSLLLDAYVHRSDGNPGVARGEGGVQRIRIKIASMALEGEVGQCPADIYEGSLTVGTSVQENMVRFPATYAQAVRLSVMLSPDGRVVVFSGNHISIEPEGEFRFVEAVDFSNG